MTSNDRNELRTIEDIPATAYRKHLENPEFDYSIAVRRDSEQARLNIRESLRSKTLERLNRGKSPKRFSSSSYSAVYNLPSVRQQRKKTPKIRLSFIKAWFSGQSER